MHHRHKLHTVRFRQRTAVIPIYTNYMDSMTFSGTGKTTVCRYLMNLLQNVRTRLETEEKAIVVKTCLLSDQTFEKLGELMSQNDCRLYKFKRPP